jgi:cyanophycinase
MFMKPSLKKLIILSVLFLLAYNIQILAQKNSQDKNKPALGKLFIIGGGEKPKPLMLDMVKTAGVNEKDYVVILPMSSELPDSAIIWSKEDFEAIGFTNIAGFNFTENGPIDASKLDSIKRAKLIFISGGDQNKFMKIVKKGPVYQAIHYAYQNGSTIAGTSAGAAVMSKKMISGNSLKYPEYTGRFPSIEPENIEIKEGLGLVEKLIVDQHFIKRQRMNRLISVSLEHPGEVCVGIDESTAIVVSGNSFRVTGENQVVVLKNKDKSKVVKGNLMGGKGLSLDVLLPGEIFRFK